MSQHKSSWHLWDRFGIELEYMIVDKDSLRVLPRVDVLLGKDKNGNFISDTEHGPVGLSNELVSHILEFKCAEPVASFDGWSSLFHKEVQDANRKLASINGMLLPGACHPFMDPLHETQLWPYDSNDIYETYNRIFNCKGHGWANLQSTHLNLSFYGDVEFGKLHAAVRLLLPLIPAIAASSPYLDAEYKGFKDGRIETYRHNQEKIPSITGMIIPEAVFSYAEYDRIIFERIRQDIAPHDPEHLLNHFFLNSRGAIARFDRGTIEIRLVDIQECPLADIAIAEIELALLRLLVEETWTDQAYQQSLDTIKLSELLLSIVRNAEDTIIDWPDYLKVFGYQGQRTTAKELWQHIFASVKMRISPSSRNILASILERGTLSSALLRVLGKTPTRETLVHEYQKLAQCLARNELYNPLL
jgi:gamma-glutamyl:cysteine ligase YbdK (ATP-grasp superfamily)